MKSSIVVTTVNVPTLLTGYADNSDAFGHPASDLDFTVIGDTKTPHEENRALMAALRERGFSAAYYDVEEQERWLEGVSPELAKITPYNTDCRRSIGYLMAAANGAESIILIDDDNFVTDGDYLKAHSIVGTTVSGETVASSTGWYNVCDLLERTPDRPIYPRGFPYSKRFSDESLTFTVETSRVVLNAGLWLGDPDVDAVTRLTEMVEVSALQKDRVILGPGTLCPVNTQNTAFHRDVLPCYYYVLTGGSFRDLGIDRYGDIWSGYLAEKVIGHMGDSVSFGLPLTNHDRNAHNLLIDLENELHGMIITESFVRHLHEIELTAGSYSDSYLELAEGVRRTLGTDPNLSEGIRGYFAALSEAMVIWTAAVDQMHGT